MIKSGKNFSNCGRVGNHANCSHNFSQISSWNDSWWLIVDSNLESGGTPINELDGSLGLNGGNSCINILGNNISSIHHGASHILSVSWVTFDHHVGWFKTGIGNFSNSQLFMISLLCRDNWCIWWQHEMNSWVRNQVGLEFGDINVKSTIKSQRCS